MKKSVLHTVIIIDDHEMIRQGLASFFTGTEGWKVCAQADSLESALALFATFDVPPDLVLLDIDLNGEWGLDLIAQLKKRYGGACPKILVYSMFNDRSHIHAAYRAGADGFIDKNKDTKALEKAIQLIMSGVPVFPRETLENIAAFSRISDDLTRRETQIFHLVKSGKTNSEIAASLGIRIRTVENTLSTIYAKTGVASRKELAEL
jgi:DNA-binding NarL/FixJ family response regulator